MIDKHLAYSAQRQLSRRTLQMMHLQSWYAQPGKRGLILPQLIDMTQYSMEFSQQASLVIGMNPSLFSQIGTSSIHYPQS